MENGSGMAAITRGEMVTGPSHPGDTDGHPATGLREDMDTSGSPGAGVDDLILFHNINQHEL